MYETGLAAISPDRLDELLAGLVVDVGDDDRRTFGGKTPRAGRADAGTGPGHNRHPVAETAGVHVPPHGALGACSSGKTSSNPSQGGGAPVKKSGTITIAYLQKQGDQQYFVDEANGAKKEAATLGGVKVDVVDLGTDSNKAISAMSTEVGQQVDGIAIVVPDQKIGPQVIDAAHGANIPIVASDDPIQSGDGNAAAFVGFDSVQMGTSVGQEAATLFKKAGWTASDTKILAAYKQDLSDCQLREQGEEQGFKAAGTSLPIVKLGTDNSVIDAQNKAGAALTANPGVKHWAVWGCNDESETGVG